MAVGMTGGVGASGRAACVVGFGVVATGGLRVRGVHMARHPGHLIDVLVDTFHPTAADTARAALAQLDRLAGVVPPAEPAGQVVSMPREWDSPGASRLAQQAARALARLAALPVDPAPSGKRLVRLVFDTTPLASRVDRLVEQIEDGLGK